jgi:ATP-dependent Clp protease adaptor protein ClpS
MAPLDLRPLPAILIAMPTPSLNNEPEPQAAPTAVEEPPAAPQAPAKARPRPDQRADHLPPFKVLLHKDDHNEMLSVVGTIVSLTPLARPQAVRAMFEAHLSGMALLLVTHKERAELYQEQFASKRLTVTIEPDA